MKIAGVVIAVALIVVVITVVLFRSTRVDLPAAGSIATLPSDLDQHLRELEGEYDDIVAGAEKIITWHDPIAKSPTEHVVVYIHGFSATRQETAPLARRVAEALGANLFETRLQGHGRGGEAMAEATVQGWLADAREAMAIADRLGERTVLIGTSTGGSLVLWCASRSEYADQLEAQILISPNLGPRDGKSEIFLWPGGTSLARLIAGPERSWEAQNPKQERYWTTQYPIEAVRPMSELVAGVKRLDLAAIDVPTLVLHSDHDTVIRVDEVKRAFERLGSPRKERIVVDDTGDPDGHVLAGDILSPSTTGRLADEIVRFVVADG